MSSAKAILSKRLAVLLGFQDGASDVLEHLLTIESSKDLLDYLSQLLGTDNDKVQSFVSDIGRFQRGESIVSADDDDGTEQQQQPDRSIPKATKDVATTAKRPPPVPASNKKTAPQSQPKSQNNQGRAAGGNNNTSNLIPLQKTASKINSTTNDNNNKGKSSHTLPLSQEVSKTPPPTTQAPAATAVAAAVPAAPRPPPKKGKAKVECGCFGYLHKPLTNCLFCGRVSCEREGYDFCNFCGYEVQPPPAPGSIGSSVVQHDAAWIHKEKLLRYDRESAQRTQVLDDQADYFSNNASERFMSQQERDEAREKEEERTRKMHQRQKMQLNLAL